MELSFEDKARIEAEERYRAEVRQRQTSSPATVVVVIIAILVSLWALNRFGEQQQEAARMREELMRPLVERGIMK